MPLYDYYCRPCNETFTQLRSMTAAGESSTCGRGHRAMKVITVPGAISVGGVATAVEEEAPASGGGCACGRGACGCGAF